jgi:hypothetical protein
MVLCTQPQIWRKYMAAHMMDSGLFGRFYIVGSEYKPKKVLLPDYSDAELFQEHFGALRRDVFARLDYLRDHPLRLTITPAARQRLTEWENALPDNDELDRDLSSRMGPTSAREAAHDSEMGQGRKNSRSPAVWIKADYLAIPPVRIGCYAGLAICCRTGRVQCAAE